MTDALTTEDRRILDLQVQIAILEPMARKLGQLRDWERDAVIFCRYCGHGLRTLDDLPNHLDEARQGPLADIHQEDA